MRTPWLVTAVVLGGIIVLVRHVLLGRTPRRSPAESPPVTVGRAAVFLVVGTQLLVLQRDRRVRLEVPKGKLTQGETSLQAAYRECFEESGLRPSDLALFAALETQTGSHGRSEVWHAYWGTLPIGTTLPFTHHVSGHGRDRGRAYHYRLEPLDGVELAPPLDRVLPVLRRALATESRRPR